MVAKFPDQRVTSIVFPKEPERGSSIRAFNGHEAWLRTPLTVLSEYQLTGGELDGAKLDAQISFPAQIKNVLTDWRVSMPTTISDLPAPSSQAVEENKAVGIGKDRPVNVLQGRGPNGIYAVAWHTAKLKQGKYTLTATVVDAAGHSSVATQTLRVCR